MSEEIEIAGVKVPRADWEATPASIRALVLVLSERLKQQDERLSQLEERLNQTSQNSSKPPSSDGFSVTVPSVDLVESTKEALFQFVQPSRHERGNQAYLCPEP